MANETLKKIAKEAKNRGWILDHTSKFNGRVSSYYFTIPKEDHQGEYYDLPMVRISDHYLPNSFWRGGRQQWDGEVIICSRMKAEPLNRIMRRCLLAAHGRTGYENELNKHWHLNFEEEI